MAFTPGAGAVISFTVEGAQAAQRQIETIGSSFDQMSSLASTGIKALAAGYAALKVGDYVKDATLLAARYETLGIVMHVAGENAGYSAVQMDKQASALEKSGISMLKARESLTDMATAGMDVDKYSLSLANLAKNLAIPAGKNTSDTLKDLITNIQQADTEGLKYMGIILNSDEALQKYATTHGTVSKALTKTQKSEAILQAAMQEGAKYSSIYDKAMGTAGKALSSLDRYFENIKVRLGTPFLEGFAQGVFGVTDGVKQLNKWLDTLESNGAMEKVAKSIGSSVGAVISVIKDTISITGQIASAVVSVGAAAGKFFDNYLGGMTTVKVATTGFALLLSGFMVEQAVIGFTAVSAAAWASALKVSAAFLAMSTAATNMFRLLQLSAAVLGWGPAIAIAARTAVAAVGTAIAGIPGAVGAAVVAAGLGVGYLFAKAFGDTLQKMVPKSVDDAVNKGMAWVVSKTSNLPEISEAVVRDKPEDAAKAAANKAEKDRKEQLMRDMNSSVVAAEGQIAVTAAANSKLKALNDLRDQQLKQSLDQRIITQADYLQKKEKMDVAEAQGQLDQIAAQKAQLATYMAAAKAGAPLGQGRDPTADANEMIKLSGEAAAAQTKLNAVKQSYAYQIAGATVEAYTKEFGSIDSLIEGQRELWQTTNQNYALAGKTAEQREMFSAQYMQSSAQALDIDLKKKQADGSATAEYVKNTSALIDALEGMGAARMKALSKNVSTDFISDTKAMRDDTTALYNEMKATFIGTEEERVRAAAAASIRLAGIKLADAKLAIAGTNDTDAQKAAALNKVTAAYNDYTAAVNENADVKAKQASVGFQELAATLNAAFDPARVENFGQTLAGAFGHAGDALGGLLDTFAQFDKQQEASEKARLVAADIYKDKPQELAAANAAINAKQSKDSLAYYATMAGAAKDFFSENTAGYKLMEGAEKAFRLMELASQMESLYTHVFVTTSKTAATAVGETAATGLTATGEAARNALKVPGVIMSFMSYLGPFGTAAAAVAIAAVLGGAFGGGSSVDVSKQRQDAQGAGTVLGDSSAKSDSIAKGIELTAANSSTQINYLAGLLTTLKTIQSDIGSFASELVQSGAVNGSGVDAASLATGNALSAAVSKIPVVGNLLGKISTSIFGGKQTLDDSGFTLDKTSLAAALAGGVNAKSYANVTTSGGWFSKDSHDIQSSDLGADADRQFGQIIGSLATSIKQASGLLGVSGDDFTNKLNSFVIDIGKVSLKGMTGDEIEKTLQSVFSKLGDQMAQAAMPDLQQFQQVGEGYLQTLVRVASDYAKVDASLQSIGKTFGAVGVDSIAAREGLVTLLGGIDDFQSKTADFATNFLTKAQQLAPVSAYVTEQLATMNLGWVQTREQFAGVVSGLDLTTAAGQQTYAGLMNLESAFAATHAAIADVTMSEQEIADQRKDLQDKYDTLTMTSEQLRAKELATIAASNVALYNQTTAAQNAKDALDLQGQIYAANGDKAGAAAVLLKQHAAALLQTDPALRALTQQLWDLQAASTAAADVKAIGAALVSDAENDLTVLQNVTKVTTDALTARIAAEKALSDAVKSTLSSMATATTDLADRVAAQAQIRAAVASVKAGGALPDADSLKDAFSAVSKDASSQFSSKADYLEDLYSTRNDLTALGDLADNSLSVDQKQLDSLNDMLDTQKKMLDRLKGIDTTGLSIEQALAAFQGAIMAAMANPANAATSAISSAYQTSLGRAPDAAGLAYWQQAAAGGTSVGDIVKSISTSSEALVQQAYQSLLGRTADGAGLNYWLGTGQSVDAIKAQIMQSDEYKTLHPFAVGTNFIPEDMPAMVHRGERIIPAADNRALMQRLSNPSANADVLAAAVDRLTAQAAKQQEVIERQEAALNSIAKNTLNTADHLDAAINGDTPLATKVMSA